MEVKDIQEVSKEMVEEWFNMSPRAVWVDVMGGFPPDDRIWMAKDPNFSGTSYN